VREYPPLWGISSLVGNTLEGSFEAPNDKLAFKDAPLGLY